MKIIRTTLFLSIFLYAGFVNAQQQLSMKEALQLAVDNYKTIKAKSYYAEASKAGVTQAKRDYLPNLSIGAQQDYGTINGQNGPLYSFGGLGVASSGLPLDHQNWNASFGALYLTNVNWDFFAFGRAKARIKTAEAVYERDNNDLQQEIFQQKVKVASAYLNLLAAQKLTESYRKNLSRADTFRHIVVTRVKNGLIAGVDSSQASAEVSGARITLTKAVDYEQEQAKNLAVLLNMQPQEFRLDSVFLSSIPKDILVSAGSTENHPLLKYYKSLVEISQNQTSYYRSFNYPAFTFVGVLQTRGSGFNNNYAADQTSFTQNYFDGVNPTRTNYLVGIGLTWNLTQPLRISQQVKAQRYISQGLQQEYDLTNQELNAQLTLSDTKIRNALQNYNEAPVQLKAASEAWIQKSVLYKNGLTNLVDVSQARYTLIRAETDRDIAYNNIWQALLLRAAASGDFNLFANEL
ncbi:TolC family protein [Pedobacter sp. HMF7647]|uniref:TolC family protein n=1 Tax=Hufsiella arboris TaxID=2695275 RepID=A0A7K1Y533_9SPHI|nr:TolC family protein [Hufsiella arboris]MXV49520.1 TolC family protein [Hufsiella arboris]